MTIPTHVYVARQPIDAVAGDGRPVLPEQWSVEAYVLGETPLPVWVVRRPSAFRDPIIIARMNAINTDGLYMVGGDEAFLESLSNGAHDIAPAREVWRLAQEGIALARTACRAWRHWRCDVTEMVEGVATQLNGVVRELSAEGVLLPDPAVTPLPWDLDASGNVVPTAQAARRLRVLHRPTLMWTIAGLGLNTLTEETPDRGQ